MLLLEMTIKTVFFLWIQNEILWVLSIYGDKVEQVVQKIKNNDATGIRNKNNF